MRKTENWIKTLILKERNIELQKSIFCLLILIIWLSIVIFTDLKHEFWRDEVRSLSIARDANSISDLYQLLKHDGHPLLWHLLLYVEVSIIDSPLVLPITSIAIALCSVLLFTIYSPFPLWFKTIFIFCGLPLYEYAVMARPYGLSMLLLFIVPILYKKRDRYPLWLSMTLALLANTNVHSLIFVVMILVIWIIEDYSSSGKRDVHFFLRFLAPIVIVFLGIALNLLFTIPREDSIVTDFGKGMNIQNIFSSFFAATFHPDKTFYKIIPYFIPSYLSITLLVALILGFYKKPVYLFSAAIAIISFGVLFQIIYEGDYRHQGLFIIFMITLYWMYQEQSCKRVSSKLESTLYKAGFASLSLIILVNILVGIANINSDITSARSSNKEFGQFLLTSSKYSNAIIVAEPDYIMESLPYYVDNLIYFPREHRFSNIVSWTTKSDNTLSLKDLLLNAEMIQMNQNRPVLIVLGHFSILENNEGEINYSYNKVFNWDQKQVELFESSTFLVASFNFAYTDENYLVYGLK